MHRFNPEPSLLTAITIIGLMFLFVGFIGWLTDPPEPKPIIPVRALDRFESSEAFVRPWLETATKEIQL